MGVERKPTTNRREPTQLHSISNRKEVIQDAPRKPFEMPCKSHSPSEADKHSLPCLLFTSGTVLVLTPPPPTQLKAQAKSLGSPSMLRNSRSLSRRSAPG